MHDTNSERRLYARVPVEFTAILNGGTVEESCKVLDFSQGGVRFGNVPPPVEIGSAGIAC